MQLRDALATATFLIKVARPGFWSTSIWFYLLPLGGREVFAEPPFWLGLIYITFPFGMLIYGCNDLADRDADRFNPRKDSFLFGARPTDEQLAALPFWIAAVQAPFVIAFWLLLGAATLAWWAALIGLTALYNARPVALKGRPGWDLLNQVGYLLVFVLASWLSRAPQAPWFTFAFGGLFAMHSHLLGEIMDYAPDLAAGRPTTAGRLGPRGAKGLLAILLMMEVPLVGFFAHDLLLAGFLASGAAFSVADLAWLWREKPYAPGQMRLLFLGWNAVAVLSVPWVWQRATLAAR